MFYLIRISLIFNIYNGGGGRRMGAIDKSIRRAGPFQRVNPKMIA